MVLNHFADHVLVMRISERVLLYPSSKVGYDFACLFRQLEGTQLAGEPVDDGTCVSVRKVARFPLVDEGDLELQQAEVFCWGQGGTEFVSYVVAVALQQVIAERFPTGAYEPKLIHFYEYFWCFSASLFQRFIPALVVVNRFRHVVFLLLVDGVAAATIAGDCVAFYLTGASHER